MIEPELLAVGLGYCARELAKRLRPKGWKISGTSRSLNAPKARDTFVFDGKSASEVIRKRLLGATHLLVSAPPFPDGDPLLAWHAQDIAASPSIVWIGYLSTIGVYGDHSGNWVDEETSPRPLQPRTVERLKAERAWLALGERSGKNVEIFRLAGIYGPGRSVLDDLRKGSTRLLLKAGQVFNRIHVSDIATALEAAIMLGRPGRVYNFTDDLPASAEDVVIFAAKLLGIEPPLAVPFQSDKVNAISASFGAENRRVSNRRLRGELGVSLSYPTYREGLTALARGPRDKSST
jgi:nucleoside-diphosphate-sugar epimerase